MRSVTSIKDKQTIEDFLRKDALLHIYEIGDLDPFFWPHTSWYGHARPGADLAALALLYTGMDLPTLLALERRQPDAMSQILAELVVELPKRFYAHLSPGLEEVLEPHRALDRKGRFLKMGLRDPARAQQASTEAAVQLAVGDRDDLEAFFDLSYPGHWFDPRMLETGQYFGMRIKGELVCAAGIHVYSPTYGVAALGNIATRPDQRGRGLALRTTARLCQSLLATVNVVGLNVKADNDAAIACYRKLGFEVVAEYQEVMVSRATAPAPG